MEIVRGRGVRLVSQAVVIALAGCGGREAPPPPPAAEAPAAQQPAAQPRAAEPAPALADQLDALHKQAREARGKKDFAEVERLRLERRRLIAGSSEATRWKQGLAAIDKAREAVARMQYAQACAALQAAWQPFAATSARQAVFGDVAMELFLAHEAARMVDPKVAPVAEETLRKCLTRAADDDPCQVEVAAALAFLDPPDAKEALRRIDERRSVADRNGRLLAIQRPVSGGAGILPWHAPVEYLLAKSSAFVLGDLDYLRGFFRPERRLGGSNRLGESWSLVSWGDVLGGGILVATTESGADGVRSVFRLDCYDAEGRTWRQLSPEVVVVSSAASQSRRAEWQLGVDDVQGRLRSLLDGISHEWDRHSNARLAAIVANLGRADVTAGVQQIRDGTWPGGPPAGAPFAQVLEQVVKELANLEATAVQRDAKAAAQTAKEGAATVLAEYRQATELAAKALNFFGGPAPHQQAMSAFDLASLRGFVEQAEFSNSPPPAQPTRGGEQAGGGGFGAASPPPPAARGGQRKSQLLDAIGQAEFLVACQAFQTEQDALPFLNSLNVDGFIAGGQAVAASRQKTIALQLKAAREQLGSLFAAISGEKTPDGSTEWKWKGRRPLKLADFQKIRKFLVEAVTLCRELEIAGPGTEKLVFHVERLLGYFRAVVATEEDREDIEQIVRNLKVVREWQAGGVDWKFYEFGNVSVARAAELVEGFLPLIVAADDLDAVGRQLQGGGEPRAPALKPGSSMIRRQFVSAERALEVGMQPPGRPMVTIALVERAGDSSGPRSIPDEQGRPTLRVKNGGGEPLTMRLPTDAGDLVIAYPGDLEGHIPIGIASGPEPRPRFIRDNRGHTITAGPIDGPLVFEMVAANGTKVVGGYHTVTDIIGIDRNIVNSFLPATSLYAPSLPAWHAYREQLLRWSPDARVRWAVPRPAFRVNE